MNSQFAMFLSTVKLASAIDSDQIFILIEAVLTQEMMFSRTLVFPKQKNETIQIPLIPLLRPTCKIYPFYRGRNVSNLF